MSTIERRKAIDWIGEEIKRLEKIDHPKLAYEVLIGAIDYFKKEQDKLKENTPGF